MKTRKGWIVGGLVLGISSALSLTGCLDLLRPDPTVYKKFAFMGNKGDYTLRVFSIDSSTGALTSVENKALAASAGDLYDVKVHPSQRFVYITAGNTVEGYSVNQSTGTLTAISGSPFAGGTLAVGLAIDPSGSYLYTSNYTSNNVTAFRIDATTGALSLINNYAAGNNPLDIDIDPRGRFVYVSTQFGQVYVYTIDSSTGALTAHASSPFAGQGPVWCWGVRAHPSGDFLYVAGNTSGAANVVSYTVSSTGALANLSGSPFDPGTTSGTPHLVLHPNGKYLYALQKDTDNVTAFSVNTSTGALTKLNDTSTGDFPFYGIAIDPDGSFLYVVNRDGKTVSVLSTGTEGESLTKVEDETVGTNPTAIAIAKIAQ